MKNSHWRHGGYSARTVPVVRLNPAVLNKSKVDNEVIRTILGEVRNPKESYMHTVGELSNFIASDAFYSSFKKVADDIISKTSPDEVPLFVDTNDLIRVRINEINAERTQGALQESDSTRPYYSIR